MQMHKVTLKPKSRINNEIKEPKVGKEDEKLFDNG